MTRLIKQLKELYGKAVITDASEASSLHQYEWHSDHNGNTFGIDYTSLSDSEIRLLNVFLPSPDTQPTPSVLWKAYIENGDPDMLEILQPKLQHSEAHMLYFSFASPAQDMLGFEETLRAYLDAPCTFVSKGPSEGYAVVEGLPQNEYREFIDIAAGDLFIALKMLVSPAVQINDLPKLYGTINKFFHKALQQYPTIRFIQYPDLLPMGLLALLKEDDADRLFGPLKSIMAELDEDTVKTLSAFFEHNLNVTNASKALFIHRNSLQYRLDKFYERSGLDPKIFHDAVIIKLLIENQIFQNL